MVDSVSGRSNPIQDNSLLNVNDKQPSQSVEKVNTEAAQESANVVSLDLLDQATVSDAAKKAYESEKEVLRFSRLAQRVKLASDPERVAQLKNLVDSGRINDYLRTVNTESLADSILNSPSGAFLR